MVWYEHDVSILESKLKNGTIKTNCNLFYGSSSIRLWNSLEDDFCEYQIANLAFGGSTLEACVYFFERLVIPSQPKSIILYAGDNDIGDGKMIDKICFSFDSFLIKLDKYFPKIPLTFISVKPSPSREHLDWQIREVNKYAKDRLLCRENSYFIDIYSKMLDKHGRPDFVLFCTDGLHMSQEGYDIWKKELLKNAGEILVR